MLVMVTGGIGGGECECIISCKCGAGQCYIQSVTVSHSAWLQVIGVYILNCFMWLLQHTQKHTVSRAFCPTNTSPAPPSLSPSTLGGFICWFCEFEWKNVVWLYTLFCGVKWPLIVFQISREVKWRTGRQAGLTELSTQCHHWSSISTKITLSLSPQAKTLVN